MREEEEGGGGCLILDGDRQKGKILSRGQGVGDVNRRYVGARTPCAVEGDITETVLCRQGGE